MKKAAGEKRGTDLEISKTHIDKTAHFRGSIFSTLAGLARPFIKLRVFQARVSVLAQKKRSRESLGKVFFFFFFFFITVQYVYSHYLQLNNSCLLYLHYYSIPTRTLLLTTTTYYIHTTITIEYHCHYFNSIKIHHTIQN